LGYGRLDLFNVHVKSLTYTNISSNNMRGSITPARIHMLSATRFPPRRGMCSAR
jgi:hypothetical protein